VTSAIGHAGRDAADGRDELRGVEVYVVVAHDVRTTTSSK
jgi:hypothetical protein